MKTSTTLTRKINATRRFLRRLKRGKVGAAYERPRVALGSLTELEANPTRPGLAVQAAMNVRRATQAAA
jgi:hypothetical protein